MSSVTIKYDSKKITIQSTKPGMWLLGFEPVIYFILFSLILFVLYEGDYSLLTNVMIAVISSVIFLFAVLKYKQRFLGNEFTIDLSGNEIKINNLVQAQTKQIERIILKESISTYSANAYYDIYAVFLGFKYSVIKGVSETDQKEIVKALKSFFNVPGLPVEIR